MSETARVTKVNKRLSGGTERWFGTIIYPDGRRQNTSVGRADQIGQREAQRLLQDRAREALEDRASPITHEGLTLERLIERHAEIVRPNVDKRTADGYTVTGDWLIKHFGARREVATITHADAANFATWLSEQPSPRRLSEKLAPLTVRTRLIGAAAVFEVACREPTRAKPYLQHNPFQDIALPSVGEMEPDVYVPLAAVRKIVEGFPDVGTLAVLTLARLCGLRKSELLAARWEDIGPDGLTVRLRENREGRGAGTKQAHRVVPLMDGATILLQRVRARSTHDTIVEPGLRWCSDERVRRLLKAEGIAPKKPLQCLRASFSTDILRLTGRPDIEARTLGHSVQVAARHYAQVMRGDVQAALSGRDTQAEARAEFAAFAEALNPTKK